MEIQNTHQAAQVSGIEANKFGFEMNAKMYDILISKMYTNKPAAVIRELSANAWDAHVEANNTDTPFELHLPTWLDKTFSIRDFGTGIPHDTFEHIYTNVGSSTKEDTNDLIGGFGLGSKTPFTMTDTFMVENIHDGEKTTWVCFKDKGEPQVSQIARENTNDPSGLKVSFAFDEGDVLEFVKQVPKQLKYFPVKPVITGGEGEVNFPELPDGWETADYFYTSNNKWAETAYVVMGNVCYDLDIQHFEYEYRTILRYGLTLKMPIGSVDIPPSRENIEMTPRTTAAIKSRLVNIKKEYTKSLQADVNKCIDKYQLSLLFSNSNLSIVDVSSLTWKGDNLSSNYPRLQVSTVQGYGVKTIEKRCRNPYKSTVINEYSRSAINRGDMSFYVNDLGHGSNRHIKEHVDNKEWGHNIVFHVHHVPKKTFESRVIQAQKDLELSIGQKPKLLSSVIGKVEKTKAKTTRKKVDQLFTLRKGVDLSFGVSTILEKLEEVPTTPCYYVELKNWTFVGDFPILEAIQFGLTNHLDRPLVFVRTKSISKLPDTCVRLTKDILDTFKLKILTESIKALKLNEAWRVTCNPVTYVEEFAIKTEDKKLKTYIRYSRYVRNLEDTTDRLAPSLYQNLWGDVGYTPAPSVKLQDMRKYYEDVKDVLYWLRPSHGTSYTHRLTTLLKLMNKQENQ